MPGRVRRTTAWIVVFALGVILPLPVSARVGQTVASEFLGTDYRGGNGVCGHAPPPRCDCGSDRRF
jgi:hypothetical protein